MITSGHKRKNTQRQSTAPLPEATNGAEYKQGVASTARPVTKCGFAHSRTTMGICTSPSHPPFPPDLLRLLGCRRKPPPQGVPRGEAVQAPVPQIAPQEQHVDGAKSRPKRGTQEAVRRQGRQHERHPQEANCIEGMLPAATHAHDLHVDLQPACLLFTGTGPQGCPSTLAQWSLKQPACAWGGCNPADAGKQLEPVCCGGRKGGGVGCSVLNNCLNHASWDEPPTATAASGRTAAQTPGRRTAATCMHRPDTGAAAWDWPSVPACPFRDNSPTQLPARGSTCSQPALKGCGQALAAEQLHPPARRTVLMHQVTVAEAVRGVAVGPLCSPQLPREMYTGGAPKAWGHSLALFPGLRLGLSLTWRLLCGGHSS